MKFAVDRGAAAGAAGVGAGAPRVKPAGRLRGGEAEVRVAAGFGGGGGGGSKAAGSVGVGTEYGIAGFLTTCLTDMMGPPNRSGKAPHSAATARSPPGGFQACTGGGLTLLHPIALAA
jgi:hypothetical protein